jgi:hypothetical protein
VSQAVNQTQNVYVFTSHDPAVRGLSIDPLGKNLPLPADGSTWLPLAMTTMTFENLRRHAVDPDVAMLYLKMNGNYVSRITAHVIPFPQANRRSA